ncbi:hypothetical protein [Nostoc sp.]|uniref:hypothetical protein n=1 Tax=Nostoc sp. TaxID=1180 RepID=UPI002FF97CD4
MSNAILLWRRYANAVGAIKWSIKSAKSGEILSADFRQCNSLLEFRLVPGAKLQTFTAIDVHQI